MSLNVEKTEYEKDVFETEKLQYHYIIETNTEEMFSSQKIFRVKFQP